MIGWLQAVLSDFYSIPCISVVFHVNNSMSKGAAPSKSHAGAWMQPVVSLPSPTVYRAISSVSSSTFDDLGCNRFSNGQAAQTPCQVAMLIRFTSSRAMPIEHTERVRAEFYA